MTNQKRLLLIGLFFITFNVRAQNNICATNSNQTQKILEHLENRLICESLPIGDCVKLFAGGAAGVGGVIAAKKLLKLGQLGLKPDLDIICGSKRETFSYQFQSQPVIHMFLYHLLVPNAEANSSYFCQLHPGASYRSEVENLTKVMAQEIERDVQSLYKAGQPSATQTGDPNQAKKQLAEMTDEYLSRFEKISSQEAQNILPSVRRQILEAKEKGDYRTVRGHIRNSLKHLESKGVDVSSIAPDFETVRKNIDDLSQPKASLPVPCNIAQDIKALVQANATNRLFIKTEFEKMKKKCPLLQVDELTDKMLSVSYKRAALGLTNYEKLNFEMDMRKLSLMGSNQMKEVASKTSDLSRKSIEKLNRVSLGQFQSPEIGIAAGKIEKWGKGLGMMATSLHSFAKTARVLSPMALLAGGKAALASTGVGALPVVAESLIEEAVTRSVTFQPEECVAQQMQSVRNMNASPEAKLGFHYLDFNLSNCQPSLEMGPKLTEFLQLSPQDRLNIIGQNDQLCSAIHGLYNQENKLSNFEASCIDDKGGFQLRDKNAEKGNYKIIQQRAREAREAQLTGDDYEKYVHGQLVSRNQVVIRNLDSFNVSYTSTVSKLSKCSKLSIDLNKETQSFPQSCSSLTRPILDSVYDYAMLSAQCSGMSQAYAEVYGKNFKTNSSLGEAPRKLDAQK